MGKRTLNISGAISAANYVLLPKLKSQMLSMTGQYLYLQVRKQRCALLSGRKASVHQSMYVSCSYVPLNALTGWQMDGLTFAVSGHTNLFANDM